MAALTLRTVKGSPLTNAEVDANFTALNTELGQKLVASSNLSDLANAATARTNLGLGNVENKSSATIRGELTSGNVTTALGFTPLSLAGGTMTGAITFAGSQTWPTFNQNTTGTASNVTGTVALANGGTGATTAAGARTNLGLAIGSNVQAWDADLDAIAALAGTSGFLKKTAANTWSLDTNTYLTGNQSITLSGDATGSGATSIALTLANSGVTAGTYTKVTVDAKGRVTAGASLASADLPTYTGTLTSSQVTTALGFTPYNATNPSGFISGITSGMVTTALGYTPYNSTNPSGYITNSAILPTSVQRIFALPNTGGASAWVYIGRWSSAPQDGAKARLTISASQGYNASVAQNQLTEVYFKTSNNSSSQTGTGGSFFGDGSCWRYGASTASPSILRVVQVDANTFDFYGQFGSFTGVNSMYSVAISNGSWTNSATLATPSGNSVDLTINQVLDASNYNSYAPTLTGGGASGTWGISISGNAATVSSITSSQVTTALGYTPYNSTNPSGYITSAALSSYLPLSGGTLSGDLLVQGTASRFPSHFFHYEYDTAGNIYEHYYAPGSENVKNSTANLRVSSTSGYYKVLTFSGDGSFNWNGSSVLTSSNVGSYALPIGGGTVTGDSTFNGYLQAGGIFYHRGDYQMLNAGANGWVRIIARNSGAPYLENITYGGNTILHAGNYSSYALPLSGGTLSGAITVNGGSNSIIAQDNGGSGDWRGRIISRNSTYDRAAFLGVYNGNTGVFAHNHALNAWAPLYVNTSDAGSFGGAVILSRLQMDADGTDTWYRAQNGNRHRFTTTGGADFIIGNGSGVATLNGNQVLHAGNFSSYAAPASHDHARIGWVGNRTAESGTTNSTPSGYLEVVGAYNNGWPTSYGNVVSVNGGGAGQLFMGWIGGSGAETGDLYYRSMTDWRTNWGSWRRLLTDANYTSYSPSLTGTGASGTWGISITGNAATATTATNQSGGTVSATTGSFSGALTLAGIGGTQQFVAGSGDGATFATYNFALSGWNGMAFYNPTSGGAYPTQVSGVVDFRNGLINMKGGFQANGNTVLHAGNYSSYALPLSGGTVSGNQTITGSLTVSSANATGGGIILADDGDIVDLNDGYCAMRFSSGVRIHSANRGGGAVITLGSNGNISAGNISSGVTASHIVQRDGNGYIYANHINFNTSESENPTINSFITSNGDGWSRKSSLVHVKNQIRGVADGTWGINVTGNAATATALQTARTINGVSFDGGANIKTSEWVHSDRDFASGTLVTTDINYAVTYGDPFVLEIRGNSYGDAVPYDIQYQGYIYSDTIINHGGYSNGTNITGLVAINVGGNLCFWWPRQSYWNGFNVRVYTAYATVAVNRVTSITSTAKPTSTKEVALSANIRQSLHSVNYTSYSPSLTGSGASGTWGINVTGSAGSVAWTNVSGRPTAVSSFTNDSGYLTSGSTINYAYYQAPSGTSNDWVTSFQSTPAHYTSFREMSANGPSGTWWFMQNLRHSNSSNYWGVQIAWGWEDNANNLYTRNITGNSFGGWVRYLNSSNYSSYALPLSGGNVTGSTQIASLGVGAAASGTAGEIRATNNITAYYSSDIRFKENIHEITSAASIVCAIGGKYFDWSDAYLADHGGEDGYFLQKQDFGVIAQDVEKVFPRAVRKRPDGSLAVDYEKLSALAFAAIREQQARLERLESLVNLLIGD